MSEHTTEPACGCVFPQQDSRSLCVSRCLALKETRSNEKRFGCCGRSAQRAEEPKLRGLKKKDWLSSRDDAKWKESKTRRPVKFADPKTTSEWDSDAQWGKNACREALSFFPASWMLPHFIPSSRSCSSLDERVSFVLVLVWNSLLLTEGEIGWRGEYYWQSRAPRRSQAHMGGPTAGSVGNTMLNRHKLTKNVSTSYYCSSSQPHSVGAGTSDGVRNNG